ncbi:MAG: hypothetical protein NTX08_06715 [Sphingobacteriales bacterium]|nr:hypothetical protein [Sphingobacteriales bacterium]
MKPFQFFIGCLILISCAQKKTVNQQPAVDTTKIISTTLEPTANTDSVINSESGTFYIVTVASGRHFDSLQAIAKDAAKLLGSKFTMMDRIYRKGKGIVLPNNAADEIYRGEYYPRRPFEDQNFVSIEMANSFEENNRDSLQMIVMANIFTTKQQADSVTGLLRAKFNMATTLKSSLYLGCMH